MQGVIGRSANLEPASAHPPCEPIEAPAITTTAGGAGSRKLTTLVVSGVGFLADAYDLFAIDFVVAILAVTAAEVPSPREKGIAVSATLAGAVIGQLVFGMAADYLGRRAMFIATATLVILGAVSSALVGWGYSDPSSHGSLSVFYQLAFTRFFMGLGIGGEYPLAATVASEAASLPEDDDSLETSSCWCLFQKPNSIAAVFSMQGVGMMMSPILILALVGAGVPLTITWRICIAMGALPSSFAFYFRWKMAETGAFQKSQQSELPIGGVGVPLASGGGGRAAAKGAIEMTDPTVTSKAAPFVGSLVPRASSMSPMKPGMIGSRSEATSSGGASSTGSESDAEERSPATKLPQYKPGLGTDFPSLDSFSKGNTLLTVHQHRSMPHFSTPSSSSVPSFLAAQEHPPSSELQKKQPPAPVKPTPQANPSKTAYQMTADGKQKREFSTLSSDSTRQTFKNVGKSSLSDHVKNSGRTLKKLWRPMIGTALSWFLIDVTLYGNGSFKSAVMGAWFDPTPTANSSATAALAAVAVEPMDVQALSPSQYSQSGRLKEGISNFFFSEGAMQPLEEGFKLPAGEVSGDGMTQKAKRNKIMTEAKMGLVVALLALPGYILSVIFCHRVGLRRLQLYGFLAVGVVFFCLGAEQIASPPPNLHALELILFGLTFLCSNFGPNTTTFILPTQLYPTVVRATCHGLSAAMGKLGGVVGSSLFSILQIQLGLGALLMCCGAVAFLGAVITYFFIPLDEPNSNDYDEDKKRKYRNFSFLKS